MAFRTSGNLNKKIQNTILTLQANTRYLNSANQKWADPRKPRHLNGTAIVDAQWTKHRFNALVLGEN